MATDLTRRQMMARAGVALGGVAGLGLLQACSSAAESAAPASNDLVPDSGSPVAETPDSGTPDTTTPDAGSTVAAGPQVADFPYQKHLAAGYQLDATPIAEAAYHGYFAGGCCHGAYSSLVGHLASTAGAPFNLLPIDFGKFGGGGIASYGSICGAVLGGVLVVNMIVENATARAAMMTDLMRWYERTAFPSYVPAKIDAGETGLHLNFSAANIAKLQVVPHSHLCHASVSGWCGANGVSASGNDKKARCARLTADVSVKTAQMLNSYLSHNAYTAAAMDPVTNGCSAAACHGAATTILPVASGMECAACHASESGTTHW